MILPFIALALPFFVRCTPVELDVRGSGCDSNNCLRALRGNPGVASSFCATYYVPTITATTTTSVPFGGLFPSVDKRNEAYPTTTSTPHAGSLELVRKADSPSAYSSKCTEAPTALSSACSCLLGTVAPTTTVTTIATYTLPLPSICSASNNYGMSDIPLTFDFNVVFPDGDSALGWGTVPGACCAYCHASPNCFRFSELVDLTPVPPGGKRQAGLVPCMVELMGLQGIQPLGVATCPLGIVTLTPGPAQTRSLFGAGPCATVLSS